MASKAMPAPSEYAWVSVMWNSAMVMPKSFKMLASFGERVAPLVHTTVSFNSVTVQFTVFPQGVVT